MIQAHPLGILFAFVFAVSIGSLFYWMFRVPPMLPLPVIQVRHSVSAMRKIIVPIGETIPSERAVELACRLGHDQTADLLLVHVITVPYSMSLNTPLPEQEKAAQRILEIGRQIAVGFGIHPQTFVLHHRHVADAVLQVAREEEADAIILGVGIKSRVPGTDWGRTTADLLQRAPCEVIVDKVPMSADTMGLQA